jgi:KUP system potassium uptake protein
VNYGFKNTPDVPKASEFSKAHALPNNLLETSHSLSRKIAAATKATGMAHWREALFAILSRNASSVAGFLLTSQQMCG